MVSDKTRELLRQQGPKVSDLTDPKSGKKEPDFADELLETKKKALKIKITADTLGGEEKPPPPPQENITATIVTEAMKQGKEATSFFRDEVLPVFVDRVTLPSLLLKYSRR